MAAMWVKLHLIDRNDKDLLETTTLNYKNAFNLLDLQRFNTKS